MKLTIYSANLEKKEIMYNWISLLWTVKYNDVGSFCAEFQSAPSLVGKIVRGDYVTFDDDANESVMIVESISFTADKFTISGNSAESILSKRASQEVFSGQNAESVMRRLVSDMAPWDHFTLGESQSIASQFYSTVSDGSVLQYCQRIGEDAGIGFRVRLGYVGSNRKMLFTCYDRGSNPVAKYSAALGNMSAEKYTESDKNYYNVAVVAGSGEGDDRITVTVGETELTGSARREIYVDARNMQPNEGESDGDYIKRLEQYGKEKLSGMRLAKLSEFTLADGGVRIGDPVYVIPTYIGEAFVTRVTSMSVKVQNNKVVRSIGAGTPIGTGRS